MKAIGYTYLKKNNNFYHWYKKDGVVYCYDRKMSRDVVVKTVPNKKHGTLTKVSWIKI